MIVISTKYFENCFDHFFKAVTCPLSFLDPPPLCNVANIVKILLVSKNENTDAGFCICIKHKKLRF